MLEEHVGRACLLLNDCLTSGLRQSTHSYPILCPFRSIIVQNKGDALETIMKCNGLKEEDKLCAQLTISISISISGLYQNFSDYLLTTSTR